MEYVSISPFWVFEEIEKGRVVHGFSKEIKASFILNIVDVGTAVELVKDAKAHTGKYEFWYEKQETEAENA